MDFEQWLKELKAILVDMGYTDESADSIDRDAWKAYYDEGYSPMDAYLEDCSYA